MDIAPFPLTSRWTSRRAKSAAIRNIRVLRVPINTPVGITVDIPVGTTCIALRMPI
jgi:hypothetical protein